MKNLHPRYGRALQTDEGDASPTPLDPPNFLFIPAILEVGDRASRSPLLYPTSMQPSRTYTVLGCC